MEKLISALGQYLGATCLTCVGGTSVREDMKRLEAGVQIVAGTPGRVNDMLNRSALRM
jgi:translation initiation factor 4A